MVGALIGRKLGMTQHWREDGSRVPVTVLQVGPNPVTAVRTTERDGYEAVQLGFGDVRTKLLTKPVLGQWKKAGVDPCRVLREVRGPSGDVKVGDRLTLERFEVGKKVDVIGTSKGKGFAGTIKRHGHHQGPRSHGSQNVRRAGSIGMCKYPGRVMPGKKMAGRMGADRVTVKGLEVIGVDVEANRLLVKGAVPGNNGGIVIVRSRSVKGETS